MNQHKSWTIKENSILRKLAGKKKASEITKYDVNEDSRTEDKEDYGL